MLPKVGAKKRPAATLPIVKNTAPDIGGGYSHKAVSRAVAAQSAPVAPRPLAVTKAPPRPAPAPKPPPVVVANNKGNYSRPAPPPPVRPGPIQNAAPKKSAAPAPNKGGGGKPKVNIPLKQPIAAAIAQPPPPVAPGPIAPPPPDINTYLAGDVDYQGYQGQLAQQLAQFQAQQTTDRTSGAASFAQRLRDLQTAQTGDESNLQEDFASRGLARSGSYADALSQLQQQYLASQGNLQTEQTGWESQFGTDLTSFQTDQQIALQQAQQEAIARRAAMYGLV